MDLTIIISIFIRARNTGNSKNDTLGGVCVSHIVQIECKYCIGLRIYDDLLLDCYLVVGQSVWRGWHDC